MARKGIHTMDFNDVYAVLGGKGGVNPIGERSELRPDLMRAFEVRDREQFVKRYKWVTTDGGPFPKGFDPDIVERILYYRYKLIAFMSDDGDGPTLFTTPFALAGGIDVYGRYTKVAPLTFNGTVSPKENKETGEKWDEMEDGGWITDLELIPSYDVYDTQPIMKDGKELGRCVILQDYENGISQTEVPRYNLSLSFNSQLVDIIALIRHNLIASARLYSYRVLDEGQKNATMGELEDLIGKILDGDTMFVPVTSSTNLDTVFEDKELETQDYWECFVSMDNLRENLMGIENNGIFNKKERELNGEAEKEASQSDLVYTDGLEQRQKFCELCNLCFGTNLWCIESAAIDKVDLNDDNMGEEDNESTETNENI